MTTKAEFFGEEPIWSSSASKLEMMQALNWYSYNSDKNLDKSYLLNHFESDQKLVKVINKIKDISPTFAHLIRMIDRGCKPVGDSHKQYIEDWIQNMIVTLKELNKTEKWTDVVSQRKKPSIQDHINNQVYVMAAEIDEVIDLIVDGKKHNFNPYEFLKSKDAKSVHAKRLGELFIDIYDELDYAIEGDEEIAESYSHLSKSRLKKLYKFIELVLNDCEQYAKNSRVVPKKRKRKETPKFKQVKNLNYRGDFTPLKIVSVDPEKIVDASQVWLFNIKDNCFRMMFASGRGGLKVSGSTLKNFDEVISRKKKLRKPKQMLTDIMSYGKVKQKKFMDSLTTKDMPINGRINNDTIILKVIK